MKLARSETGCVTRRSALARDDRYPCPEAESHARASSRTLIRGAFLRPLAVTAAVLLAACSSPRAEAQFVVLLYHHVAEDTPAVTSVSPAQFESHLAYLEENGFTVWSLSRAVDALESGTSIPDRTLAITFDDAYRDILTNAAPMLAERGWPFTVFVATRAVDEGHGGIMDWDELRKLQSMGAELANHGHAHDHLNRRRAGESESRWLQRARADIETGARRLKAETGAEGRLFAWPYGEFNRALEALADELGLVAFTQASGAVGAGYGRQRLPRFPVAGAYAELDTLRDRFDALPLPVREARPDEPQLPPDRRRPVLELTLDEGDYRAGDMSCFVSGQGRVAHEVLDKSPLRIRLAAQRDLPAGRSRYNCTAPSMDGTRYYWFSQPWFLPNPGGTWPPE